MDYTTFCIIIGIMFWVLCALGIVCGMISTFIYYVEYRWKKDERDYDNFISRVHDAVLESLDEIDSNSGGNEQ